MVRRLLPGLLVFLVLVVWAAPALAAAAEAAAEAPADAYDDVTIGFLPLATRNPEVTIRGTAPLGTVVLLSVNGVPAVRAAVGEDMAVYRAPVRLTPGYNWITAQVEGTEKTARSGLYYITQAFADLAEEPLKNDIEILATLGVVSGTGQGNFEPGKSLTRAELSKMLVLALGLKPDPAAELTFTDAAAIPEWARPYVAAAYRSGLLRGYPDGSFQAGRTLTRAELIATVVRAAPAVLDAAVPADALAAFADQAAIPDWARSSAALAVRMGLVDRFWGAEFQADAPARRAETAAVLRRLIDLTRAIQENSENSGHI